MIQRTYNLLNLHIENIDVDFYRNSDGFDMIMQCNYPEAALDTDMYAKNTTFYASKKRIVSSFVGDMLESQLP